MNVFTARIWTRDPDRFDVTRGSGGPAGEPFAPTQAIIEKFRWQRALAIARHDLDGVKTAWRTFREAYITQMRASQKQHPDAWKKLMERERVVLVCYCPTCEYCHRGVLADMMIELGAMYEGELEVNP